jgi:hypothetical protein
MRGSKVEWINDITDYLQSRDLLRTFGNIWFQLAIIALISMAIINRWRGVLLVLIVLFGIVGFVHLTAGGPILGVAQQTLIFILGCFVVMGVAIYLLFMNK